MIKVEVCAASLEDCIKAERAGADRIELNQALHLGGLTPSLGSLIAAKKHTTIPIISMVRPRAGGFHYSDYDKETMYTDAELMIDKGANGLVFGFLNEDLTVDKATTKSFVNLCHRHRVEAIFHRAFDRAADPHQAVRDLIDCGIDRILTNGQAASADQGISLLADLQKHYSDQIAFCVGAGVTAANVVEIIEKTGISDVHSTFKGWFTDPTTASTTVSYRYSEEGDYDGVSVGKLEQFIEKLQDYR